MSAAVFVAFTSLGIFLHGKILHGLQDRQRLYQTAIKTENGDEFNYSIDTKQGNIMTYGTFHFVDFVKFPEMTKKFSQVTRTEEKYTRHEEEVCEDTYDSEGNVTGESCHTEVSYSWDYNGSDSLEAKKVKFFGREYSTSMFALGGGSTIDASEIVKGAEGRYWYPEGDKGESFFGFGGADVGDIRYHYDVRGATVTGSIFVNTYNGLKAAEGDVIRLEKASIDDRVKQVATEANWASGGFIFLWIILTLGTTAGVTYWWVENLYY